jgi:hypothetical protein
MVHASKMTGSNSDDWIYSHLVTHAHLITRAYKQYSVIVHLYILQTTVAHALRFTDSTSLLPATDLNTQTIRVLLNHTVQMLLHYSTHKVFTSHFKSSQDDCTARNSRTSRGCLLPRTPRKRASVSPTNP